MPDPLKSFRIPAELYLAAQAKAKSQGVALSVIVRRALESYVKAK